MTDIPELRRMLKEAQFGRLSSTTNGAEITDDNFDQGAAMQVTGDWADALSRSTYAQAVVSAVNALPALLDEVERLQKYESAWAIARENLLEENERLREILAQRENEIDDLNLAATISPAETRKP